MESPSLRDLPGFPPAYIDFVEDEPSAVLPSASRKDRLVSRCREFPRQTPHSAILPQIIKERQDSARGRNWLENVERLARGAAVVVGTSIDRCSFNTSLVPLLKCLTAIKLASEISREGIAAVPMLRVDIGSEVNFIENLSESAKLFINKEIYTDDSRDHLSWLVNDLGLISVDGTAVESLLAGSPDFEDLKTNAADVIDLELNKGATSPGGGCASGPSGSEKNALAAALRLRLCLPVAVEIVGPDDFSRAALVATFVEAAGLTKPILWPRVSATVVDLRSRKLMDKYNLELPAFLSGSAGKSRGIQVEKGAAMAIERLEVLAKGVNARMTELCRSAGDPRNMRKLHSSGSRVLYQVRRLAERSRSSAEARHEIATRQLEWLRRRIGSSGELQETGLAVTELVSAHSEAVLPALFQHIDVWDPRHQLVRLD